MMNASKINSFNILIATLIIVLAIPFVALAADAPIVIEHYHNAGHGDLSWAATLEIAERFNQSQSRIQVNVTYGPGTYNEELLARVIGGIAPDIVNIVGSRIASFAANGLLLDVKPYAERSGIDLSSELVPFAVEYNRWGDEYVGLPQVVQPFNTYFNVDHFERAGLADPIGLFGQNNWTWDTMRDAAKRLTIDRDGDGVKDQYGARFDAYSEERVGLFVNQAGGQWFHIENGHPVASAVNSPEFNLAMEFLAELIHTDQAMYPQGSYTFRTGRSSMTWAGPWRIGTYRDILTDRWDIAPVPRGPVNDGALIHVDGVQIMKSTKHPDEAWEWMRFLIMSPEAAETYSRYTGRPLAYIAALPSYMQQQLEIGPPANIEALTHSLFNVHSVMMFPMVPEYEQFRNAFRNEITKAIINRAQPIKSALESIERQFNELLKTAY